MNKILRGTVYLAASALFIKVVGAVYRLYLTSLIGADGVGIYQMVFPFYAMLLTLSSSGIPAGLATLIAGGVDPEKVVYKSVIALSFLGLLGSGLMFFGSEAFSALQKCAAAAKGFRALSPSVFLVSVIAVIRGYFQGQSKMGPTAISQVIEQVTKCALGIVLIRTFSSSPEEGAFFACLAVTLSEGLALSYLIWAFFADKNGIGSLSSPTVKSVDFDLKGILGAVLPAMVSTAVFPMVRTVDTFIVVRGLKAYTDGATGLYGLYAGGVEVFISVFTSLSVGLSASALPSMVGDRGKLVGKRLVVLTVILSLSAAAATWIFAPFMVGVVYSALDGPTRGALTALLKFSAVNVLLLPVVQVSATYLIARGRGALSARNQLVGAVLKVIALTSLVQNPKINIYALAFSDILCYFVAAILNLLYIISKENKGEALGPLIVQKRLKGLGHKDEPYHYRPGNQKGGPFPKRLRKA
ncbi:MAG: oligosaccharide flippase family protein [Clostridia bacterium]|nr:oligosaccharide flippase family protein [Clostridia bacterium]